MKGKVKKNQLIIVALAVMIAAAGYLNYTGRLFGENALTCVEAGVMAPLVGVIGSLQAMEAIKVLAHYGTPAAGKIVMYDAMTCQFREMKLMRNPGCEVCSK